MSEEYTFQELMKFSDSRLDRIEEDLIVEREKLHRKKLHKIGKILWLQNEFAASEE